MKAEEGAGGTRHERKEFGQNLYLPCEKEFFQIQDRMKNSYCHGKIRNCRMKAEEGAGGTDSAKENLERCSYLPGGHESFPA